VRLDAVAKLIEFTVDFWVAPPQPRRNGAPEARRLLALLPPERERVELVDAARLEFKRLLEQDRGHEQKVPIVRRRVLFGIMPLPGLRPARAGRGVAGVGHKVFEAPAARACM
jgi:hypothetical protein